MYIHTSNHTHNKVEEVGAPVGLVLCCLLLLVYVFV